MSEIHRIETQTELEAKLAEATARAEWAEALLADAKEPLLRSGYIAEPLGYVMGRLIEIAETAERRRDATYFAMLMSEFAHIWERAAAYAEGKWFTYHYLTGDDEHFYNARGVPEEGVESILDTWQTLGSARDIIEALGMLAQYVDKEHSFVFNAKIEAERMIAILEMREERRTLTMATVETLHEALSDVVGNDAGEHDLAYIDAGYLAIAALDRAYPRDEVEEAP